MSINRSRRNENDKRLKPKVTHAAHEAARGLLDVPFKPDDAPPRERDRAHRHENDRHDADLFLLPIRHRRYFTPGQYLIARKAIAGMIKLKR